MIDTPINPPLFDTRDRSHPPMVLRYAASIGTLLMVHVGGFGCSSTFIESHAINLPLHLTQHEGDAQCIQVQRQQAPAYIYRCRRGPHDIFVSKLHACHHPEKYTYQASTRQLLVGFADLQILSQAPVALNNQNTLRSIVHATLDATPVLAATFTHREKSCITDLVIWRSALHARPSPDEIAQFEAAADEIAAWFTPTEPQREGD